MKKSLKVLFKLLAIVSLSSILNVIPNLAMAQGTLIFSFKLVEQKTNGRQGTMKIYAPQGGEHGMTISELQPENKHLDLGLWVETLWNNKGSCNDAGFLNGGQQEGWLLGPVTDRDFMAQAQRPDSPVAYGVLTGSFGDLGKAVEFSCDNLTNNELEGSSWLLFVRSKSEFSAQHGYWVAEGWYPDASEEGGSWYSIYNDKPF